MIFMVRFCYAGPKKPLEVWFSQLCRRGEAKMMLCLFSASSLVALLCCLRWRCKVQAGLKRELDPMHSSVVAANLAR